MAPTAKPHTGIYMIRNAKNGRFYIGSAMRFNKRWKEHLRGLENNRHHSKFMQRDWNKNGPDCFSFSILTYCYPADLISIEQKYIDKMKPVYNSAPVAGSQLGLKMSDQARKKMSLARRKDFSPMTGKQHTAETKAKISATKTGVKMGKYDEERVKKTAAAMRAGKNAITDDQARLIRTLKKQGLKAQNIADLVGCTIWPVYDVLQGKTYKWVI